MNLNVEVRTSGIGARFSKRNVESEMVTEVVEALTVGVMAVDPRTYRSGVVVIIRRVE